MKKLLKYGIIVFIVTTIIIIVINSYVRISTKNQIIKENEYTDFSDIDCIIILGAGIWGDKGGIYGKEKNFIDNIRNYYNYYCSNNAFSFKTNMLSTFNT